MSTAPLDGVGEARPVAPRKTIPFDVAFRYTLTGEPELVHREIVTISIEATFVAVSIGYGVVPLVSPRTFGPLPAALGAARLREGVTIRDIPLGAVIDGIADALDDRLPAGQIGPQVAAVLRDGLRINSAFTSHVLAGSGDAKLDQGTLNSLFQPVAAPPDRILFEYALFDDGTGREFQSEPILNIAGLGAADGDRPFRYFARPITFAPRSTIRLEITEKCEFAGDLHVSLQGYKVLGAAGSPTGGRGRGRRRRHLGSPGGLRPLPR